MKTRVIDILLVEDNPGDARLIRELLKEGGLGDGECAVAENLADALSRIKDRHYDVVILDLNLSDSSGIATLESIVETTQGMIPVIVLTGLDDEGIGVSSIEMGAEDYLVKGTSGSELLSRSIIYAVERKKSEMALRKSEEKYRTLVETAPSLICKLTPDGTTLFVNSYVTAVTGYTPEDVIGRNWWDLFYPGELGEQVKEIMRAFESGDVHGYEMNLLGKNGAVKTITWDSSNLWGANGELVEINGVGMDITERKQAEEDLRRSQYLLNEAEKTGKIGGWEFDVENLTQTWTEETFRILEIDMSHGAPKVPEGLDFIAPSSRPMAEQAVARAMEYGEPYDQEWEVITAKGNTRWVRAVARITRENDAIARISGSFQDITDIKRVEATAHSAKAETLRLLEAADQSRRVLLSVIEDQKLAESKLLKSYQEQETFNKLLRLSLGIYTLSESLHLALDILMEIPWLSIEKKGAVFLADSEADSLSLYASRDLDPLMLEMCAKVPSGVCLCGRAAATGQIMFSDTFDERHDRIYAGMGPHGHYCVPLLQSGKTLGVLNLYLAAHHEENDEEKQFLVSMAALLAGIIDRKQAEEKLRKRESLLQKIFEILPVGLWVADKHGTLQGGNPAGVKIWGAEPKVSMKEYGVFKARRVPSGEKIMPEDWALAHTIREGVTISNEQLEIDAFDGKTKTILNFTAPIIDENGAVDGAIVVNEDITERLKNEKELASYRTQLEELVQQRTAELERTNVELETEIRVRQAAEKNMEKAREEAVAANRAKSAFLSSMSHEIRTPLNAILGFSQLLLRDSGLTPKQMERLVTVNRSGEHLLALINDILEFSKIEAGRVGFNPESFDLIAMMTDITSMFKLKTDARQLKFLVDLPDNLPRIIITDEGKLRQILINLLGNAVKFTTEGVITLRARRNRAKGGMIGLIIEVEDTGPGISAEDSKNLFQAFTQTQKGVRAGGTGLGLALSRQFARLMGGDITVRSEPDRGSCFTVSIIVQKGEYSRVKKRLEERRVAGVRPGQDTYRVLVADDNEDNRALIRELLAPVGFQLEEAADGNEVIEKFKSWSPHIILMDMRMPVISGYEAIVRIKDMKGGKETPIIAVTASAFAEDREKVLNWGADGYLRKPFKDRELFDFLKTFLGVEYVYEEDTAPAPGEAARPSKPLSPGSLRELPDELIDEMLKATLNLDQDRLMELIDGAGGVNNRTIEGLKGMVKSYQYDALIGLLNKRKKR